MKFISHKQEKWAKSLQAANHVNIHSVHACASECLPKCVCHTVYMCSFVVCVCAWVHTSLHFGSDIWCGVFICCPQQVSDVVITAGTVVPLSTRRHSCKKKNTVAYCGGAVLANTFLGLLSDLLQSNVPKKHQI